MISSAVPHKGFVTYKSESNSPTFQLLNDRLLANDTEFFKNELEQFGNGYLIEATFEFNFESSLSHSIDLGSLPFLKLVQLYELSRDQIDDARRAKKNVTSGGPKLVSSHQSNHRIVDFVANFFFSTSFLSLKCQKIHQIIRYKAGNILGPYLMSLQVARGNASSKLLSKVIKTMANSIPVSISNKWLTFPSIQITENNFR